MKRRLFPNSRCYDDEMKVLFVSVELTSPSVGSDHCRAVGYRVGSGVTLALDKVWVTALTPEVNYYGTGPLQVIP